MAEARQKEHWSHTSVIVSVLANIHRDPKKARRYSPDDFNPYKVTKPVMMKAGVDVLKQVFIDRHKEESIKP